MRTCYYIGLLLLVGLRFGMAQQGLYHQGSMHIADGAQVGIYTNWINDAPLEENFGLIGFYGNQPIEISGAFPPIVFDSEIFNPAGVDLSTSLFIRNSFSFFEGDLRSSRFDLSLSSFFEPNASVQGSSDTSKMNGQVSFNGQTVFNAPTGSNNRLRSVDFNFGGPSRGSCTYFFEDPSFPLSIPNGFSTASLAPSLDAVSSIEFWLIQSDNAATMTVSWDRNSLLSSFTDNPDAITLVGWDPSLRQWAPLPVQNRVGGLDEGFITTQSITPNLYSAFTFGILDQPDELLELGNYFLSPNGDGVNDRLVIEELEQSPNNRLVIFNRAGLKVFEFNNYSNQFRGNANSGSTFYGTDLGLPEGIYYYIARLDDLQLNFQGFIFLDR